MSASLQTQITVTEKIHSLWDIPYGNKSNKNRKWKDIFSSRGNEASDEID